MQRPDPVRPAAVSRSEGPCGPSEATGAEAQGAEPSGRAKRAWRRPAGSAAVEVPRQPEGGAGSPPGWNTAAPRRERQRTRARRGSYRSAAFVRETSRTGPPPAGSLYTGPQRQRREEAGCVTASLARSVPLGSGRMLRVATRPLPLNPGSARPFTHDPFGLAPPLLFIDFRLNDSFTSNTGPTRHAHPSTRKITTTTP